MKSSVKVFVVALVAGVLGAYIFSFFSKKEIYVTNQQAPAYELANMQNKSSAGSEDFVLASALSSPCVVYIKSVGTNSYDQPNWFGWYFNNQEQQVTSSGSGVIYSEDGYIITNYHVIEQADKIEVIDGKKTYTAQVVGADPSTDLAVLKVDAKGLHAIKVGTSKDLKVGEWVLAVGNPFNLTSTVTAGIVSAKARNIHVVNSQFPIESFIQTDAAINPGNSGGALVNTRGELVGINTAILSKTGSYSGYGFAVPVDIVSKVVKDIVKYGEVQKAFLGAEVNEITSDVAAKLKLQDLNGVLVSYIQKEGAAEKMGLEKGDIITKVNDLDINSKSSFDEYLSYYNPGDKIKIVYKRGDKTMEGNLTLTNREGTTEIIKHETYRSENLGADFEAVSKVERDKLGLEGGVRITNIRNGLIRRLGISEGFVITSINRVPINTAAELADILEKIRGKVVIEGITSNGLRGYYSYYF